MQLKVDPGRNKLLRLSGTAVGHQQRAAAYAPKYQTLSNKQGTRPFIVQLMTWAIPSFVFREANDID
jgi:hypothetical protein